MSLDSGSGINNGNGGDAEEKPVTRRELKLELIAHERKLMLYGIGMVTLTKLVLPIGVSAGAAVIVGGMALKKKYLAMAVMMGLAALLMLPSVGHAAAPKQPVLHVGSAGPACGALKWLVSGHAPNAFTKVKPTYVWQPHSPTKFFCGSKIMAAVAAYKYRLGWPAPQWKERTAGAEFFDLVLAHKHWPIGYVERAQKRLSNPVVGTSTSLALRIIRLEETQITPNGQSAEIWGWNWGPMVRLYQLATGQLHTFWCVSFQQWAFIRAGWGPFADRTASVFYTVSWASQRHLLRSRATLGALVAFRAGAGHMGIVTGVTDEGFSTVEGNASDGVRARFYRWGQKLASFIWLPGVAFT